MVKDGSLESDAHMLREKVDAICFMHFFYIDSDVNFQIIFFLLQACLSYSELPFDIVPCVLVTKRI